MELGFKSINEAAYESNVVNIVLHRIVATCSCIPRSDSQGAVASDAFRVDDDKVSEISFVIESIA